MRQSIEGTLYTQKLEFKKISLCSNENLSETGHILSAFVELVGLPPTLHSYNHKNFKEWFSSNFSKSL